MFYKNTPFARYMLLITLLLEGVWFFLTWALMFKSSKAWLASTILLPVVALIFHFTPAEKRSLCTGKDLKLLNDLARGAFFATASFTVMILLGICKYLSANLIKNYLFYVLIGQFALHVFAVLTFTALAVLAPPDARKKPIKLAIAIYIVSTLMQLIVFPETMTVIGR